MEKNNSPEFHKELHALARCSLSGLHTYTACIVNGVRFMVLARDAQRATQNSGVEAVGVGGEKYYGQLEEIWELKYIHGYSTIIFRCKWFHSETKKNITTIDTSRELHQDDQLIFASQAKQVFYIRKPSRGAQSEEWVVEHVNHRRIWENVNNAPVEEVDIAPDELVHSVSSSSEPRLVIDFSRYFPVTTVNDQVVEGASAIEVAPPTGFVDHASDNETDHDEYDSEYDNSTSDSDFEGSDGEN